MTNYSLTIILPARNEAINLRPLLVKLTTQFSDAEIIVVNDGSTDDTIELCRSFSVRVVSHPYGLGNGAAIKAGARAATGARLVLMDADGQHNPGDIPLLLAKLDDGYAMAVGARRDGSQASWGRKVANRIYNRMASWMTNHPVLDLTSGFRAVRTDQFREFLYLLPNGFSYPSTITMAFFRSGYPVAYVPIVADRREGKSHIRPLQDGVRFLLIIFKIGTLYSPLKLFFPISLGFFLLGLWYYSYTFITQGRFTNMGVVLFVTAVVVFLMGLVSEQISGLFYQKSGGQEIRDSAGSRNFHAEY
ncbi:dolichol-phosphate hexosyltransferase [Gammaproteobacteria bacterium]